MRPEAQAWWDLAREDLESARVTIDAGRFYVGAFLCQQCVEKALKAVWMVRKRRHAPKTHNLMDLAEELEILARFETPLLRLNPQYVATRYPDAANGDPARNYNRELAELLLHDAQEVIAWCQSELQQS
jgi:HEPN domain-containing protein